MAETAQACDQSCICKCDWPSCACRFPQTTTGPHQQDDGCARCGQASSSASVHTDGRRLDLCGDHTTEHRPALVKQGWTVVDFPIVLEAQRAAEQVKA